MRWGKGRQNFRLILEGVAYISELAAIFMGAPFSDITLYTPTSYKNDTPVYWEQTSLQNFISDLYVQKMYGYKPPKTSRVSVQPAFHGIWNKPWKFGSIANVAPYFNFNDFNVLDKNGKYHYILDLIQRAMFELSDEYNWDKTVFDKAYNEVIKSDFKFKIDYPLKQSRDKKKKAKLFIEKNETITSVLINIEANSLTQMIKLFDKKNIWWYDCVYLLARHNKWFDTDKFGIGYGKGKIDAWYSIDKNEVFLFENGNQVTEIDFKKFFIFG